MKIIKILERENCDWKINKIKSFKKNIYITKNNEIESVLGADREDIRITIYKKFGKEIGESSFPVTDIKELKDRIKEAKKACEFTKKRIYEIPNKIKKIEIKNADKKMIFLYKQGKLGNYLEKLAKQIIKEFHKYDVELNGMEIFFEIIDQEVINSKGLKVKHRSTNLYIESVITVKKTHEFFPYKKFVRLNDFNVKEFVKEYVDLAFYVLESKKAKFKGRIILSGDAIKDFFAPHLNANPLVAHCSAKLHYMMLTRYKINEQIIDAKKDKITIINNPLDYNVETNAFDSDGIYSKKSILIKDNVFKNYLASKQYADYLEVEPSGPMNVVEVKLGKYARSTIYKGDYFEIVSFSSFCPNSLSGDFSAEIRLGYLHKDGKKISIKGGMFTGNVFKLFEKVLLGKEECVMEGYKGPKYIAFLDGNLA